MTDYREWARLDAENRRRCPIHPGVMRNQGERGLEECDQCRREEWHRQEMELRAAEIAEAAERTANAAERRASKSGSSSARQPLLDAVCACCSQPFVKAARKLPAPGRVWTGALANCAGEGVCGRCYNDRAIDKGEERDESAGEKATRLATEQADRERSERREAERREAERKQREQREREERQERERKEREEWQRKEQEHTRRKEREEAGRRERQEEERREAEKARRHAVEKPYREAHEAAFRAWEARHAEFQASAERWSKRRPVLAIRGPAFDEISIFDALAILSFSALGFWALTTPGWFLAPAALIPFAVVFGPSLASIVSCVVLLPWLAVCILFQLSELRRIRALGDPPTLKLPD